MKYRRGQRKDVCCYNCNECGHYSGDCLLPKRRSKEQRSWVSKKDVNWILWKVMKENNWKPEDFAAEETDPFPQVSMLFTVKT